MRPYSTGPYDKDNGAITHYPNQLYSHFDNLSITYGK